MSDVNTPSRGNGKDLENKTDVVGDPVSVELRGLEWLLVLSCLEGVAEEYRKKGR